MTQPTLLGSAGKYVKEYAAAVVAADLMRMGVVRCVSALNNPFADWLLRLINATMRQGFRGRMPLRDVYGGIPWSFHAAIAAEGIIAIMLGILVGLGVNSWEQCRPTPDP